MKKRKIMIAGMLICAITAGCGTALPHADGMGETERETKEAQLNSSDETEKIQSIAQAEEQTENSDVEDADDQLAVIARTRNQWVNDPDYADEMYQFAIADLDHDGRLELIVSNCGGTGIYTYSRFYRVEENGTLKELKTSFVEGDSQPDLIADELTVYRKETKETLQEYYIVYDDLRVSPAEHLYATDAMSVLEDEIKVETLATMSWLYVAGNSGDEGEAQIVCKDADGNPLTEEAYQQYAQTYFKKQGYTEDTLLLRWTDIGEFMEKTQEGAEAFLKKTYE